VPIYERAVQGWEREEVLLKREDGSVLRLLLHTPPQAATESREALPTVLFFHGGGYNLGGARDSWGATLIAELANEGKAPLFAWAGVDYRLAPEAQYPAAAEDGAAALDALKQEAFFKPRGLSGVVHLAGVSAGAGLAATVAADALDRGIDVPTLVLAHPMLDPREVKLASP